MALTLLVAELVAHLEVVPLILLPTSLSTVIYRGCLRVFGMFLPLVLSALSMVLLAPSTNSKPLSNQGPRNTFPGHGHHITDDHYYFRIALPLHSLLPKRSRSSNT